MSENGNGKLLEVRDVSKMFSLGGGFSREKLVAVRNANLSMSSETPEIFTLAGESGSGKTTLAKLILNFEEATSGKILYKEKDVTHIRNRHEQMQFMREIQPVFQNPFETFNPLKIVEDYLFQTAINYRIAANKKQAGEVVEECLQRVGLTTADVKERYPNEFSGGQLQRVSLARALITNPSLLITDEPVSMVDASLRMSIVNLFKKLKDERGVSIIYITHDLATAYYVSDRIAIMLRGNIVEMGTVEQVLDNPKHPYTQILKDSVPEPDPKLKWTGNIALTDLETVEYKRAGCKFADRCPSVMDVCYEQVPDYRTIDGHVVMCHLYEL